MNRMKRHLYFFCLLLSAAVIPLRATDRTALRDSLMKEPLTGERIRILAPLVDSLKSKALRDVVDMSALQLGENRYQAVKLFQQCLDTAYLDTVQSIMREQLSSGQRVVVLSALSTPMRNKRQGLPDKQGEPQFRYYGHFDLEALDTLLSWGATASGWDEQFTFMSDQPTSSDSATLFYREHSYWIAAILSGMASKAEGRSIMKQSELSEKYLSAFRSAILAWLAENRSRLIYDPRLHRFRIPD